MSADVPELALVPVAGDDDADIEAVSGDSGRRVGSSRERIRRNTLERARLEVMEVAGICVSRNWMASETAGTVLPLVRERLHDLAETIDRVRLSLEAETADRLMTEVEAAEYYMVSVAALKRVAPDWEAEGRAVKIGKKWRFRK